jgi:hypothetical protein
VGANHERLTMSFPTDSRHAAAACAGRRTFLGTPDRGVLIVDGGRRGADVR